MTVSRTNRSSLTTPAKAVTVKKSVSFTDKVKIKIITSPLVCVAADQKLQATDKRRKYMRRGSKAPTMMFISQTEINRIDNEFPDYSYEEQEQIQQNHQEQQIQYRSPSPLRIQSSPQKIQQQQRRLSMMSALKCHFDRVTIIDTKNTTYSKIHRLSSEHQRRYSLEVVLNTLR